jgi:hypothetical protein
MKIEFDSDSKSLWWLNDNNIYFYPYNNTITDGILFGDNTDEISETLFMSDEHYLSYTSEIDFIYDISLFFKKPKLIN